jgi:ABC-type multidrug transport system ATPase subunit
MLGRAQGPVDDSAGGRAASGPPVAPCLTLRLREVWKRHGSTAVLRGVSADLSGVAVVRGANGSGKSTLLGVVAGALKADRGRVELGNHNVPGGSVGLERGQVGWLAHEGLLYGDLSGRANVELAARLSGVRVDWEALRARFGLGTFADRPVRTLSRGQAQRVALARAMVGSPPVLLLDEPTTGLDRDGVALLRGLVAKEAARGAVVVVVTHEASVVWGDARDAGDGGDPAGPAARSSWQLAGGRLTRVQ